MGAIRTTALFKLGVAGALSLGVANGAGAALVTAIQLVDGNAAGFSASANVGTLIGTGGRLGITSGTDDLNAAGISFRQDTAAPDFERVLLELAPSVQPIYEIVLGDLEIGHKARISFDPISVVAGGEEKRITVRRTGADAYSVFDRNGTVESFAGSGDVVTLSLLGVSAETLLLRPENPENGSSFTLVSVSTATRPTSSGQEPVLTTPIPAALPLFLSALAGAGFIGWRRRRRS